MNPEILRQYLNNMFGAINVPKVNVTPDEFATELMGLLNRHGIDNDLGIPDYIIADHILDCIDSLKRTKEAIDRHTGNDE